MFNRAVNAFRKGIHRKSSSSASQDDDISPSPTEDDYNDDASSGDRMSVRSTPSFQLIDRSSSCCSTAIGGSLHSSEGIFVGMVNKFKYISLRIICTNCHGVRRTLIGLSPEWERWNGSDAAPSACLEIDRYVQRMVFWFCCFAESKGFYCKWLKYAVRLLCVYALRGLNLSVFYYVNENVCTLLKQIKEPTRFPIYQILNGIKQTK